MNEQKMLEQFEAWLEEGIEETGAIRPSSDKVASYLAVWEGAWQAATAATQRDAMAVAEAVHQATCEEASKSYGAERMLQIDLAAIVEAVRPNKREAVNQQLLAALKDIANDYADRFDIASSSTNPGIKIVIEQARAAITTAEAAQSGALADEGAKQPASAQQHGEPVAPKLIGWRTDNYLWETSDRKVAEMWEPHYAVLPIFEGDSNTTIAAAPKPAGGA